MTLQTQVPRVVVTGNGTRGPYSLVDATSQAIRFVSTSHVRLKRYSSTTDEVGDTLVENTDYTIGGTQDARTFTLSSGQAVLASTERIVADRNQSYTQDLSLSNGGSFGAVALMNRLDKYGEYLQELKTKVDRKLEAAALDSTPSTMPLKANALEGDLLGFDADKNLVPLTPADIGIDTLLLGSGWSTVLGLPAAGIIDNLAGVRFVATYSALTALTTATGLSDNSIYCTYGRAAEEDGGFGFWRYDSGSSATADGGTILAIDGGGAGRFFRLYTDEIHVEWFGAKGDNSTDDATAIQAACACAQTYAQAYQPTLDVVGSYIQTVGKVVFKPGRTYRLGATISLYSANHWVAWGAIFKAHASLGSGTMVAATSDGSTYFNGRFLTIEGGKFEGGTQHIDLYNGNINGSVIRFIGTEFWGASSLAIRQKCESALIRYERCVFEQNAKALLIEHATALSISQTYFNETWITHPRWTANNQHAIENRGYYSGALDHAGGVLEMHGGGFQGFEEATNSYTGLAWIKNSGEAVRIYRVRFPRELGGVCAVNNFSTFRTVDTAPATEVKLIDCEGLDNTTNASDRVQLVRLSAVPNMLTVRGCKASLYTPLVEFATGTTPSSLVSGGSRDLIKVDIKGNWSAFETSVNPVSDYIPAALRPYDINMRASFSAHKNGTDQTTIADATATKVTFTTELFDGCGVYDAANSKVTGLVGQIRIAANVLVTGTLATTSPSYLLLYKNGSLFKYGPLNYVVTTAAGLTGDWVVDSTYSDYWEIYVYIDTSAGTGTVSGTAELSYVQGSQV